MKKSLAILFALSMLLLLCACGHSHTWTEATCTEPKTCSECGATEGEALGHTWVEATCTEPKTCSVCGATEGEALGHTWVEATCTEPKTCSVCGITEGSALGHVWTTATCTEPNTCSVCGATEGEPTGHVIDSWEVTKKSTCTETGIESGVCTVCGETVEVEIAMKDHTPSDWIVTVPATSSSPGTHVKKCEVCGQELESESFTLSAAEIEKQYKAQCKSYGYKDLQRNPGKYKGKNIKVSGKVFQIISESTSALYYSTYFINSSGNIYFVRIDNYGTGTRILENDTITVWGEVGDLYTYETVRGNANTVVTVTAEYYK